MTHATLTFIGGVWIAWLVYWVVMAFRTKHTIERSGYRKRVHAIIPFVL